ncbi:MAG: DoxX family protein [Alphaproteobacteria bacterium]|nr:DoxX family protein [Alphaproteobacteria bacterium]
MQTVIRFYTLFLHWLDAASPAMMLLVRLYIAHVFWASGILKISDWSTTLLLFTDEHPVPGLPPAVAAVLGTTFELCCPVLLTLGLAARLATLPLLVMTAVINFTYQQAPEHYHWALLLGMILFFGPGRLSLDHLIARRAGHGNTI